MREVILPFTTHFLSTNIQIPKVFSASLRSTPFYQLYYFPLFTPPHHFMLYHISLKAAPHSLSLILLPLFLSLPLLILSPSPSPSLSLLLPT
jgi:hypothetical protein